MIIFIKNKFSYCFFYKTFVLSKRPVPPAHSKCPCFQAFAKRCGLTQIGHYTSPGYDDRGFNKKKQENVCHDCKK